MMKLFCTFLLPKLPNKMNGFRRDFLLISVCCQGIKKKSYENVFFSNGIPLIFFCLEMYDFIYFSQSSNIRKTKENLKPCLDGILPSSVSNLRGDYHNPLPAKLVHTQKINLRRLVICWKTHW